MPRRAAKGNLISQVMDIGLAVGLAVLLGAVYLGDLLLTEPASDSAIGDEQVLSDEIDPHPLVQYAVSRGPLPNDGVFAGVSPGAYFGINTTEAAGPASFKKLTYDDQGRTNSTRISINGETFPMGRAAEGRWLRLGQTRLAEGIKPTPGAVKPSHSTWVVPAGSRSGLHFHQVLEIVPGQTTTEGRRFLDAVLIRWVIHNQGSQAQKVGLRFLLDTLIGANDGVPFTVPGRSELVSTFADFPNPKGVPDFLQALEFPNLRTPGTVAHLTVKVGGEIEPPDRLSLTHWSPFVLLKWDIPIHNLRQDSAVVLYWSEKLLQPNAKRVIGFAYGLGSIASSDKLAVTLGGALEPGRSFTVTAYVANPTVGQTLRLELPEGLERVEGAATQSVSQAKAGGRDTSIVTWKVKVERVGDFRLVVHSSTGIAQAKTFSIRRGTLIGR